MERDSRRMRGERPFVFTNLKTGEGLESVIAFLEQEGLLETPPDLSAPDAPPSPLPSRDEDTRT